MADEVPADEVPAHDPPTQQAQPRPYDESYRKGLDERLGAISDELATIEGGAGARRDIERARLRLK